jgi:hypothetical protein
MRRDAPELLYTGRSRDEPPRRRRIAPPDPAVTNVDGRGFRRESSIVVPDFTVTQAESGVLAQRAEDAARERKGEADRRFRRALELAETLRTLREG